MYKLLRCIVTLSWPSRNHKLFIKIMSCCIGRHNYIHPHRPKSDAEAPKHTRDSPIDVSLRFLPAHRRAYRTFPVNLSKVPQSLGYPAATGWWKNAYRWRLSPPPAAGYTDQEDTAAGGGPPGRTDAILAARRPNTNILEPGRRRRRRRLGSTLSEQQTRGYAVDLVGKLMSLQKYSKAGASLLYTWCWTNRGYE